MSDSTDSAKELLPCPFCGSSDSISERADFGSDYRFCNNCAARGPIVDAENAYEEVDGDVVMEARTAAAWNRRAEMSLECFVSRPDNTVGMAYLDRKGFPFADTVCSTERGAMVNYLVTVCRITPMADWSDAKIKAQFEMHKMGGSVGPVSIERLIVEQDQ